MTPDDRIRALQRTELFGQVPGSALKKLAAVSSLRALRKGEILFSAGEAATGLFVVVAGSLRAFRHTIEGREQTIHVESAGATLAEVPIFDRGSYPSTVQAEEDSQVLFLPTEAVHQFLIENPEAALSALGLLARRLRYVTGLAEKLALRDVAQRLAAMLVEESVRRTGQCADGAAFSLPLSHQSIAARLGSVREVITRNLRKLADDEVISIRGHHIVVLDGEALQARSGLKHG